MITALLAVLGWCFVVWVYLCFAACAAAPLAEEGMRNSSELDTQDSALP